MAKKVDDGQVDGEAQPEITHDDREAAKAEHYALLKQCEADRDKAARSRNIREKRIAAMKKQGLNAEEIADAEAEMPPVYAGDPKLHKDLHKAAYKLADIEKALNYNQAAPRRRD